MVNRDELKAQVAAVLSYSQNLSVTPKIDKLMDKWFEAKSDIIESFGGEMIYEAGPVTFHLSKEEQTDKLSDFISRCERVFNNAQLAWFLYQNAEGFFDNVVTKATIIPTGEKITEGMKLLKAFKFFEKDEAALKQLQTEASMLIQENKIEGELCLSVHPLDFLSSSENTYNWRSCHALDGEFRSGNLSYMCDKSTIVCYLRGKDKYVSIPRFPDEVKWNSKKWRMLLFLSESWQAIFAGRQYPFVSEAGLEQITPHLRKALHQKDIDWSAWHNDCLTHYTYQNGVDNDRDTNYTHKTVVLGNKYYNMGDLVTDAKDSRHFNDLLRSSCYVPYYQWNKRASYNGCSHNPVWPSKYGEHFLIGSSTPCIVCGESNIALTDAMFCDECAVCHYEDPDATSTCDCCGASTWTEDMYCTADGSWVCPNCADNECTRCYCCGELFFNDDVAFNRSLGNYYCNECMKEIMAEEET